MSSAEADSLAPSANRRSDRLRAGSANPAFQSPLRARSRSPAPSVGSDDDVDAVGSGRPAGIVSSANGPSPATRGAAAAPGIRPPTPSLIQQELDAARRQLAAQEQLLADQRAVFAQQQQLAAQQQAIASVHAENARLHAQLALANAHVPAHAPAAVSAVDAERLKLGLGSLDTLAATDAWRQRFAVRTDITVGHVSTVVAGLFHGLGSVPHAAQYQLFIHAVLALPAEGEDVPSDDYMGSAAGAQMAAKFGITARPTSPGDDRSSDSGSGSQSSAGTLSRRRAADVTAVTAALLGDTRDSPDLTRIHIIDAALHAALKRLTCAGPDTPEYEAVNLQSTFIAALSALLTCADHAELSIGQRTVARAFGVCPLYHRGGASIASLSVSQCARLVAKDAAARLKCLRALHLPHLAVVLALAAAPVGTENRGAFSRGLRKAALRAVPTTAEDLAGLSSALDDVADKYLNMLPTGVFKLAQPAELYRALSLPAVPMPVAAPALAAAKSAAAKAGARPPPTADRPRPATGKPNTPPPGKVMCPLGAGCTNVVLAWDPATLSGPGKAQTMVIRQCTNWHPHDEWQQITATLRSALQPPPAPPTPPVGGTPPAAPPAAQPAPRVPASPAAHLAAIEAYIQASGGPVKATSCPAIRAEPCIAVGPRTPVVPAVETLQDAVAGLRRALVQAHEDVRCVTEADAGRMAAYRAEHLGRSPFEWHQPLLEMWLAYVQSIADILPSDSTTVGVAAAAAARSEVVLFDSAASDSMKAHQPGADGPLRSAPAHQTQVANGSVMSVTDQFGAAFFVRDDSNQLIKVVETYDNNPGLSTSGRALTIISAHKVVAQGGEARMRADASYLRFLTTDPACPDLPPFLSGRVSIVFGDLRAAQLMPVVPVPGEPYHLACIGDAVESSANLRHFLPPPATSK